MNDVEIRMNYTYEGDSHSILYLHKSGLSCAVLSGYGEVMAEFMSAGVMAEFLGNLEKGVYSKPKYVPTQE